MGMWVTPALPLTENSGFKAVVQGLLGIAGSRAEHLGIDICHQIRGKYTYINLPSVDGGEWWVVVEILCRRICILGRATHVYRIKRARTPLSEDAIVVPLSYLSLADDSDVGLRAITFDSPRRYYTRAKMRAAVASALRSRSTAPSQGSSRQKVGSNPNSRNAATSQPAAVPKVESRPPPLSPPPGLGEIFWNNVETQGWKNP